MFEPFTKHGDKKSDYARLLAAAEIMVEDESSAVANLANLAALLKWFLEDINWVGFYLYDPDCRELVLGPFQGLPACIRIPLGKGVCGTAAREERILNVPDVHEFPGHIACDSGSRSEIVVPLLHEGLVGVLDVDSPLPGRFDADDEEGLAPMAQLAAVCLRR